VLVVSSLVDAAAAASASLASHDVVRVVVVVRAVVQACHRKTIASCRVVQHSTIPMHHASVR